MAYRLQPHPIVTLHISRFLLTKMHAGALKIAANGTPSFQLLYGGNAVVAQQSTIILE